MIADHRRSATPLTMLNTAIASARAPNAMPPCPSDSPRSSRAVGNSGDSSCSPTVAAKYAPHTRAIAPQRGWPDGHFVYSIHHVREAGFIARPTSTTQTIGGLLDLAGVTDVVEAAFGAWGRGEAATTQRVRSQASGAMASAMAAVAPPYSGGKVYATNQGVFTFVIVLFDIEGRLLCTLDGDELTRLRTPATCALADPRVRRSRSPIVAAVVGAGRQGWTHLLMLAEEIRGLGEVRIHDRFTDAARDDGRTCPVPWNPGGGGVVGDRRRHGSRRGRDDDAERDAVVRGLGDRRPGPDLCRRSDEVRPLRDRPRRRRALRHRRV